MFKIEDTVINNVFFWLCLFMFWPTLYLIMFALMKGN